MFFKLEPALVFFLKMDDFEALQAFSTQQQTISTDMSHMSAHERALELADRLGVIGPISVTRFFGGAGLVKNGIQFAFIIEGVPYLRVNDLSRPDFEMLGAGPFIYATRSKMVQVASYYAIPNKILDNNNELIQWAMRAYQVAILAKSTSKRKRHKGN